MKRIIRYITWHLIDKRRLHKVMKKRRFALVEPKRLYDYSKELAHPKGLEDLKKLKKEIEELEKEWEQTHLILTTQKIILFYKLRMKWFYDINKVQVIFDN